MKVYLHCCCAPCSIIPIESLLAEGHDLICVYSNSNIYPNKEYEHRRDTFFEYARSLNLEIIEDTYSSENWEQEVGVFAKDCKKRCAACYAFRFKRVASIAAERGGEAIASTLTISPYQDIEAINTALRYAAGKMFPIESNFQKSYPDSVKRSREFGMYRQKYCGCRFSIAEAEAERKNKKSSMRRGLRNEN